MSSALPARGALTAATIALALTLAACGGGEPPSGQLGQPVELDDVTVTLVDVSGSPAYVGWEVTASEDGGMCPAPNEVYVDAGGGDHVQLDRATDWSCTVLGKGETGRVRLLAPGGKELESGQTVVWLDTAGHRKAIWPLP